MVHLGDRNSDFKLGFVGLAASVGSLPRIRKTYTSSPLLGQMVAGASFPSAEEVSMARGLMRVFCQGQAFSSVFSAKLFSVMGVAVLVAFKMVYKMRLASSYSDHGMQP